jgi:hypothetical protein|tara:strand:+ start:222 stop:536 length:315 start_codon:yes stop_codon:yes gene_type:complete
MKQLKKKITVKGGKQSTLFNSLKRTAWHLSNNVASASGIASERKANYYKYYNDLKTLALLEYDKELKQSKISVNYDAFINYLETIQEGEKMPQELKPVKTTKRI